MTKTPVVERVIEPALGVIEPSLFRQVKWDVEVPVMATLRDHPNMSYRGVPTWPPLWTQTRSDGVKKLSGELGVLIYVHSACPDSRKCYLVTEYENENYVGTLLFDNATVCREITTLLRQNLRRPIKEIGDLDVSVGSDA